MEYAIRRCTTKAWDLHTRTEWHQTAAAIRFNLYVCRLFHLEVESEHPFGVKSATWDKVVREMHKEVDLMGDVRVSEAPTNNCDICAVAIAVQMFFWRPEAQELLIPLWKTIGRSVDNLVTRANMDLTTIFQPRKFRFSYNRSGLAARSAWEAISVMRMMRELSKGFRVDRDSFKKLWFDDIESRANPEIPDLLNPREMWDRCCAEADKITKPRKRWLKSITQLSEFHEKHAPRQPEPQKIKAPASHVDAGEGDRLEGLKGFDKQTSDEAQTWMMGSIFRERSDSRRRDVPRIFVS